MKAVSMPMTTVNLYLILKKEKKKKGIGVLEWTKTLPSHSYLTVWDLPSMVD